MAEPTYTLGQAAVELRRRECSAHGHSWDVLSNLAGPSGITCSRCGASYAIATSDHDQAVAAAARTELHELLRAEVGKTSVHHSHITGLLRAAEVIGVPDAPTAEVRP